MDEEYKITSGGIGIGLTGKYKVQVINSTTKEIVADYGWNKNLILNNGLDAVASVGLCNLNVVGIAGTGSRPNSITSSTSTITQSGTTVYLYERTGLPDFTSAYSSYTSSVNVGDVLQYSNLSESTVTAITDGFNLQVDTSYNIDTANSQSFTIWKTSQTRLEKEIKRSSTYFVGAGNCGTTTSQSTKIYRRTYDFTAEASIKNYTELGTSWDGTANGAVFSRIVLPQAVVVEPTYQLRLIHDLQLTFTPNYPRYITASISGWTNTMATESIQVIDLADVDNNGISGDGTYSSDFGALDPAAYHGYDAYYCVAFLSDVGNAPAPVGSYVQRTLGGSLSAGIGAAAGISTYVNGTYTRYKYSSFGLTIANSANIRSLGMGQNFIGGYVQYCTREFQAMVLVFDQLHSKENTQIATLTYKFSWGRLLSNGA